jgi:hypothetical protein
VWAGNQATQILVKSNASRISGDISATGVSS